MCSVAPRGGPGAGSDLGVVLVLNQHFPGQAWGFQDLLGAFCPGFPSAPVGTCPVLGAQGGGDGGPPLGRESNQDLGEFSALVQVSVFQNQVPQL